MTLDPTAERQIFGHQFVATKDRSGSQRTTVVGHNLPVVNGRNGVANWSEKFHC